MSSSHPQQPVRHNVAVNLADGALFGMGMGFASYVTVIPLFVASLTDSTVLIGLIATLRLIGWQMPQLFMAGTMARVSRFLPPVLKWTLHERLPMLMLGLLALAVPFIPRELALGLAFLFITWQSLGAGMTANPWQSLIAKILPARIRGTFYGTQSGSANLLSSVAAVMAGALLLLPYPTGFALCFFLTTLVMLLSWIFLAMTREAPHEPIDRQRHTLGEDIRAWRALLRADVNFRWFLVVRALIQFGQVGGAFYTVYALRQFNVDMPTIGLMTGVMLLGQMAASPIMGLLGDRFGHRYMLALGCAAMAAAALIAITAPAAEWLFIVFALTGLVNGTQWTTTLAFTAEFGDAATRPFYVGLSNTLIVPATLVAPLIGGAAADAAGFGLTFALGIAGALAAGAVILFLLQDPGRKSKRMAAIPRPAALDD